MLSVQTRILVTHGVSFLPYVDEIVVLVDGVVSEVGTYNSLRASKGAFSEFLDTYAKEQSNRTHSDSGNFTFFALWMEAAPNTDLLWHNQSMWLMSAYGLQCDYELYTVWNYLDVYAAMTLFHIYIKKCVFLL